MEMTRYRNRTALVTGGLGFVGSNLARALCSLGAEVTIVDAQIPGCGANPYNLEGCNARVIEADVSEPERFESAIADADVIFNLAGEISHIHSMQFPERDLQLNTVAHLRFLDACRRVNRGVRVVYAGTRQVYGRPEYLPVDELHPIRPVDYNGVHKYAASMYHQMMSDLGELDAIVLRLTNVYGPRMSLNVAGQGFLGVFFRKALLGEVIQVFGEGSQMRDPAYIDDVVDAFLRAGLVTAPAHRTINIGGFETLSLRRIAEEVSGKVDLIPFSEELKAIDIGSYYTDSSRAAAVLNWRPRTCFAEGVKQTLEYYRAHQQAYLNPEESMRRDLPEHTGILRRLVFQEIS